MKVILRIKIYICNKRYSNYTFFSKQLHVVWISVYQNSCLYTSFGKYLDIQDIFLIQFPKIVFKQIYFLVVQNIKNRFQIHNYLLLVWKFEKFLNRIIFITNFSNCLLFAKTFIGNNAIGLKTRNFITP